jgi:tetratricopeptide (TPR) repeat protein
MEKNLKQFIIILNLILWQTSASTLFAQPDNKSVRKGNRLYKEGKFQESVQEYKKAAGENPSDPLTLYNLGNAVFRTNNYDEAITDFDKSIELSKDKAFIEKSYYNKGVSYTKQKKLLESIEAYKAAIKIDPADADVRHNLQKALHELRKQNKSDENKQDQEKQQKQQQPQQKQPKEQQSKFNRRQVEQLMKALRQKEQDIQQKMQQNRNRATSQPDKDW